MGFYLRQSWRDPRLAFQTDDNITGIRVDERYINSIWRPDVFIRNEKGRHETPLANDNSFLNINSTGDVWFVERRVCLCSSGIFQMFDQ